ncbi:MAG: SMP-30/gluconolactonase/LRE family protein, partial [Nitrospirota bacterium]|nr:SMP-30/gluconolactonase/LRE family protein [Nitrospirota bacterium]
LGEGPIWSVADQALYWVDIVAPAIHRWHPASGERRSWPMPEPVGSLSERKAGGLIVALASGFAALDVGTGALTLIRAAEADLPDNRFNDGRCDRAGRFWAGSLTYSEDQPLGALWRLDPDHTARPVLTGITVPNALCWSPDGRIMYFTDTSTRQIMAYAYDLDTGTPSDPRLFVEVDDTPGYPDGAIVDSEGGVWNAEWDGARVVRYAPDGTIDRIVEVPAPRPTCCAFGGPDLSTLFITSAWDRLSESERAEWPLSGNLFAVDAGVRGLPDPQYEG